MAISAVTPKSWKLNSYTNSTWTDLVAGTASGESVKGLTIANNAAGDVTVSVRVVTSGGTLEATILPLTVFATMAAQTLAIDVINLTASQKIQVQANLPGVEFYASGVTYA
ncbi:MAG: hypothetical protein WC736_15805 [Gallionella sp.]|jgi:hypothetical protein